MIKKIPSILRGSEGAALVIALLIMAVLSLIGTTAIMTSSIENQISKNDKLAKQAFYAADGGLVYGVYKLQQLLNSTSNPTTGDLGSITAPDISGYTFDTFTIEKVGSQSQVSLTVGNFAGLNAFVQRYKITSEAGVNGTNARAEVAQYVEDQLIPLFQFGVFYENDLEILPGPNMTFAGGRIHSNSNIYLGSNATFSIDSIATSAGDIFNRRKDGGSMSGKVRIKDGNGVYQLVDFDSDSTDPDWVTESQARWDGRVKSQDHGIQDLNLPLPETSNPIDIIKSGGGSDSEELREARFYWKAGLKIVDGTAYDKNDFPVDISYDHDGDPETPNISPVSIENFYDAREEKYITVTTVDIDKLKSSQNAMDALNNPPSGGDPGILYTSESGSANGTRLVNGSQLPSGGLTVASDNPVYIQGDYNTDNKPAAVCGDAITILSNNWNDANSSGNLSSRVASNTTVKAAIMAGNKETQGSQYSGGLENFPRFLEKWSGKTFTYSGSLVCLWESEQATGNWKYGSPIYTAPNRNWSYGIDPSNLPPGTPRVRTVQKSRWYEEIE